MLRINQIIKSTNLHLDFIEGSAKVSHLSSKVEIQYKNRKGNLICLLIDICHAQNIYNSGQKIETPLNKLFAMMESSRVNGKAGSVPNRIIRNYLKSKAK